MAINYNALADKENKVLRAKIWEVKQQYPNILETLATSFEDVPEPSVVVTPKSTTITSQREFFHKFINKITFDGTGTAITNLKVTAADLKALRDEYIDRFDFCINTSGTTDAAKKASQKTSIFKAFESTIAGLFHQSEGGNDHYTIEVKATDVEKKNYSNAIIDITQTAGTDGYDIDAVHSLCETAAMNIYGFDKTIHCTYLESGSPQNLMLFSTALLTKDATIATEPYKWAKGTLAIDMDTHCAECICE